MKKLWGMDSPFWNFLEKAADLIILNMLTILCSLPVVTIGASVTALYHAVWKMQQGEGSLYRGFFRAFKENFLRATALWMIILVAGGVWSFGLIFCIIGKFDALWVVAALLLLLLMCLTMTTAWVFPMQAHFHNKVGTTLKNALLCALAYLPRTILMTILNLIPIVIILSIGLLGGVEPLFLLVWFALAADWNTRILKKPFEQMKNIMQNAQQS